MAKKGFTLIEAIVVVVILSIVAFVVMTVLTEGFRVYVKNKNIIGERADLRNAIESMGIEIKQADSLTLTSSTDVSITSDMDGDGISETIRYYLDTNNLRKQISGSPNPGNILCSNVSSLTFSYSAPVLTVDMSATYQNDTIKLRTKFNARST